MGPFFDGLFAQSDYGICTSMSIALKRRPSGIMGAMFMLNQSPDILVPTLRKILQAVGGLMGPLKLTNHHRIVSLLQIAPQLRNLESPLAQHAAVKQFYNECHIPLWHGFFPVYTDKTLLPSVKKLLAELLDPVVENLHFIEDGALSHPQESIFIDQITGTPSDKALAMAYFRAPQLLEPNAPFSPEKDGAGILWFAPLIPAKSSSVKLYLHIAHEVLDNYNFEPALSFTSLSDRCFDSVLALLFNSHDKEDIARAKTCYEELFVRCRAEGFVPYRMPHSFDHLTKEERLKTESSLVKILTGADF